MHAFIFWGFLVLFPTIFMALVAIVDREPSLPAGSPLGWLERQGWYALMVDVFVVLVLARRRGGVLDPEGAATARFDGSHLGEADLILGLIAGIVTTLLLWHATLIALGLNAVARRLVAGLGRALGPVRRRDDDRGARARLRVGARRC